MPNRISPQQSSNKEFMISLVQQNGAALQFASKELKKDVNVVFAALKQGGASVLQFAAKELFEDELFMRIAVKQYGDCAQYLPANVKQDKEKMLQYVKINHLAIKYAPKEFTVDCQMLLRAIRKQPKVLAICHQFTNDRQFMLDAIRWNSKAFDYASTELKDDRSFVIEAVKRGASFYSIGLSFSCDTYIRKLAAAVQPSILRSCLFNEQVVLYAYQVNPDPWILEYVASKSVKLSSRFLLEMIRVNAAAYQIADAGRQSDRQFNLSAVKMNDMIYDILDETLQRDCEFLLARYYRPIKLLVKPSLHLLSDLTVTFQLTHH